MSNVAVDDSLDDVEAVLSGIEAAVQRLLDTSAHGTDLIREFKLGLGTRSRLQNEPSPLRLQPDAIIRILTDHSATLRAAGRQAAVLGLSFVSIALELEASSAERPQQARILSLQWRAARILDRIGPDLGDRHSNLIKAVTRH